MAVWSAVTDRDLATALYQLPSFCLSGGHLGVGKILALPFTMYY
jgi:hypothetical protein